MVVPLVIPVLGRRRRVDLCVLLGSQFSLVDESQANGNRVSIFRRNVTRVVQSCSHDSCDYMHTNPLPKSFLTLMQNFVSITLLHHYLLHDHDVCSMEAAQLRQFLELTFFFFNNNTL